MYIKNTFHLAVEQLYVLVNGHSLVENVERRTSDISAELSHVDMPSVTKLVVDDGWWFVIQMKTTADGMMITEARRSHSNT